MGFISENAVKQNGWPKNIKFVSNNRNSVEMSRLFWKRWIRSTAS